MQQTGAFAYALDLAELLVMVIDVGVLALSHHRGVFVHRLWTLGDPPHPPLPGATPKL